MTTLSAGAKFRAALAAETPLQVMGAITALAPITAPLIGGVLQTFAGWRFVFVALIAFVELVGFIAFGNFIVDQIVWTTFVIAGGYLLHNISDNAFASALAPETAAMSPGARSSAVTRPTSRAAMTRLDLSAS